MKQYLKRTWRNKIVAILMVLPALALQQLYGDGTMLVIILMVAVPLFFAKKNYIE